MKRIDYRRRIDDLNAKFSVTPAKVDEFKKVKSE